MNMRTIQQVAHRLKWAQHDAEAIKKKTLALVTDLSLDDASWALWTEITEHIANVESHLRNALAMMPELPEPGRDDLVEAGKQERIDAERAKAFVQWLHAAAEEV